MNDVMITTKNIENELTEPQKNIYILLRDHNCRLICGGDLRCDNIECIEYFLKIAGQIEKKENERHEANKI
jgi:hypothetical protein